MFAFGLKPGTLEKYLKLLKANETILVSERDDMWEGGNHMTRKSAIIL
jgi:hypothetical protein